LGNIFDTSRIAKNGEKWGGGTFDVLFELYQTFILDICIQDLLCYWLAAYIIQIVGLKAK
jgi:hypothetical protein